MRVLHLCGNDGVTDETIKWLKDRIKGIYPIPPADVKPPQKQVKLIKEATPPKVSRVSPLNFRSRSKLSVAEPEIEKEETKFADLQDGIKLRNVVRAVRMNEVDKLEGHRLTSKLII